MEIDRRTLLTLFGAAALNPILPASAEPSVMDRLATAVHSGIPFNFCIWSYVNLRGENMISYGFRSKTDRFQLAKVVGASESVWSTWTEKIAPDCRHAAASISHDERFDPFMASGRPEQRS